MVQEVAIKRKFEAGLRHTMTGKLLCQPNRKWVPFSDLRKDKAANGEG